MISVGYETLVERDFRQRFVDFHDIDFVAQAGPAAEHVGIFLGGAAGFFGVPVAQKNVVRFAVAVGSRPYPSPPRSNSFA